MNNSERKWVKFALVAVLLVVTASSYPFSLILDQGAFGSATWTQAGYFDVSVQDNTFMHTALYEVLGNNKINLKYAYAPIPQDKCTALGGAYQFGNCYFTNFSKFEVRNLNIGISVYDGNYNPPTQACRWGTGTRIYEAKNPSEIQGNYFTVGFERIVPQSCVWDDEKLVESSWASPSTFKLYPIGWPDPSCAQVVTAACNQQTKEIKEFTTPCDVVEPWTTDTTQCVVNCEPVWADTEVGECVDGIRINQQADGCGGTREKQEACSPEQVANWGSYIFAFAVVLTAYVLLVRKRRG